MRIVRDPRTKLCHLKPGDTVRLLGSKLQQKEEVYVVAVFNEPGKHAARPLMSHGLYDEERPLFLVNLDTGEAIRMPHLSSLVLPVDGVFLECGDEAVAESLRPGKTA